MRAILQRVSRARVTVDGETVGEIGRGVLALVGVARGDGEADASALADKVVGLRIFEDAAGKTNLSAAEVGGAFLVVSQFSLGASLARGRRPSFDLVAPPELAAPLVERVVAEMRSRGARVEVGRFRARMAVELVNDGPLTFVVDVRDGKVR